MLTRDQQTLVAAAGSGLASAALLDKIRTRGLFEGGCSAPQPGCWIGYNTKAIWLEDHSEFSEAIKAAGTDKEAWRRIRPRIVTKVSWAAVAAHGTALPPGLRGELETLHRTERDEERHWSEFSDARGGWPHRRRFPTDAEHAAAQAEWDQAYNRHLAVLRDIWDQRKTAVGRALPLSMDDEPVDLLELLDQQTITAPTPPGSAQSPAPDQAQTVAVTLQAAALQRPSPPAATPPPDAGLFSLPAAPPSSAR
ncbi:hypothetical protein [Nocardioides sp. PD653]|uniref:hypothetical protein n=1 Tax=Nocardioides sp. PD653 TaxID=393303 RepID=UPI0009EFD521|nr:hypothetical protein [Nocardioides sp. PD653]GAW54787.1 uncharacterized protein PD653_2201 [Nocardioides sp. PD653]